MLYSWEIVFVSEIVKKRKRKKENKTEREREAFHSNDDKRTHDYKGAAIEENAERKSGQEGWEKKGLLSYPLYGWSLWIGSTIII